MIITDQSVPKIRIRNADPATEMEVDPDGDYVVYWMLSSRRPNFNFGLQRAIQWAKELNKPLVIFEALRSTYQWNSDRFHAFVIQGMADNAKSFAKKPVTYFPYVEPKPGDERGLLRELGRDACVVVADDFPCFFLPRMTKAASRVLNVRFELVDSNGLYPMRATDRVFSRAYDFRRHLQKTLLPHLAEFPKKDPLRGAKLPTLANLPDQVRKHWPATDVESLAAELSQLANFPINHDVGVCELVGGSVAGTKRISDFIKDRLDQYTVSRNEPEKQITSGLSPYLHFGHVSTYELFSKIAGSAGWSANLVAEKATGKSTGWWGTSEAVESFLDQFVTWRELGYNMCALKDNFTQFESLPNWVQKTLSEHEQDHREYLYSLEQFESAQTHDPLWNAAQWQLVTTGVMHNYLRMLWGKKILEWTTSPREALSVMIELNNKYALDGRNPNSYSGIFWVLGRYDRAWGEREVFGKVRFMSSANTARKIKTKNYIEKFSPPDAQQKLF